MTEMSKTPFVVAAGIAVIAVALLFSGCRNNGPAGNEVWQSINFCRTNPERTMCFNLTVTVGENGEMLLSGYCNGEDGKEYSAGEGLVLSDGAVSALRAMELDSLGAKKKKLNLGFAVADGSSEELTLIYADGRKAEKQLSEDTLGKLLELFISEFDSHKQ